MKSLIIITKHLNAIKRLACILCTLAFLIFSHSVQAQNEANQTEADKKARPAYLAVGLGLNRATFRDFATSPLIYAGYPLHISLSHVKWGDQRESHETLSYSFGTYKNEFNKHSSESAVKTLSYNNLELFQLKKLSRAKFNFKVGAQLNATFNLRENEALFNNGDGLDIIATLFGSMKATVDLSREEEKQKKFLFIRYTTKKRVQNLAYTLNIGVINSSFRNGFAYTNPSPLLNENEVFANYEFQVFSGFRLNSSLDYTVYLQNKNAIQFSYMWDAYSTGGHHNNFEMTAHILKFSLLFGLK